MMDLQKSHESLTGLIIDCIEKVFIYIINDSFFKYFLDCVKFGSFISQPKSTPS